MDKFMRLALSSSKIVGLIRTSVALVGGGARKRPPRPFAEFTPALLGK